MLNVDALRAHLAAKIADQKVEVFPTPHLVIPNLMPEPVFEQILAFNPFGANKGKAWVSKDTMKKVRQDTPYDHRNQIDVEKDQYSGSNDAKAFWRDLSFALMNEDWLAKQIYALYPPYFDLRFGELVQQPDFFSLLRRKLVVQRHEPGFFMGPHTDAPHRVFTCIFAWSAEPGFEQYGTTFQRPTNPLQRCWGDLHHKDADFSQVKTAPYARNSFLVFFKTRHSFHGVPKLAAGIPGDRYGAQLAYYEPSGGLFQDLSRPDLMENRTAKPIFRFDAFGRTLQLMRK
jgi:hypothetical protein